MIPINMLMPFFADSAGFLHLPLCIIKREKNKTKEISTPFSTTVY